MFKSVVVPLDGSFTAEKILPWVKDYAIRTGAKVNLVRAIPPAGISTESDHDRGRDRDDALRYLQSVISKLGEDNIATEVWVKPGPPAPVVIDVARKSRSGLIALTTRGSTTVRRGLFGGTAEKILRMAPQSLLLVHASDETPESPIKIKRILVPLDGSDLSESIVPTVAQLARWHESRLLLLYVRPFRSSREFNSERLQELCEQLEKSGVNATYAWAVGDASNEILAMAKRKKVGMIAMNSHGRSGFSRFLLGSVAEEVVHGADVPVYLTCRRKPLKEAEPTRDIVVERA